MPGFETRAKTTGRNLQEREKPMYIRTAIALNLMLGMVQAAEPAPKPEAQKTTVAASATPRPRLNLRLGDVRKYMMPNEYRAAVTAPDAERNTVVVEAERPVGPLESEKPQPVGLGAVYSLFRHPLNAWRLFVPDTSPNAATAGPPDVVPAREFRWGP
jgi:hypothetical protein